MKKTYLFIIAFLSLALIASVFLVLRTTVWVNKATTSNQTTAVLENSYIFVSPLQAKADDREKVRLTVYLLDSRGLGVPNQSIDLNFPQKVNVTELQKITDDSGKAIFDLTSGTPGQYRISAKTYQGQIPQQVKVFFY